MLEKEKKRYRRHQRIRSKIFGTAKIPRLFVFRSGKHIYAQLIDDEKSKIIAEASDLAEKKIKENKVEKAEKIGKLIAQKAKKIKIERVAFDRGGYKYHGRIKAVADGAREEGLKF